MSTIEVTDQKTTFQDLGKLVLADDSCTSVILKDIEIGGTHDDVFDFSRALRGHPTLETVEFIHVDSVNLDDVVNMLLVSVPHLKHVRFEKVNVSQTSLASITYCSTIQTLALPNNGLDDSAVSSIALALSATVSLVSVDLANNNLSDKGCLAIQEALEKNSQVQSVNLEGNKAITPEQMERVEKLSKRGGRATAA